MKGQVEIIPVLSELEHEQIETIARQNPMAQAEVYDWDVFRQPYKPPSEAHRLAMAEYLRSAESDTSELSVGVAEAAWAQMLERLAANGARQAAYELAALKECHPALYAEFMAPMVASLMNARREGYVDGVVAADATKRLGSSAAASVRSED